MNAFQIAWDASHSQIACALSNGRVEVFQVNAHGAPDEALYEILHHHTSIVGLEFVDAGLVVVDDEGRWSLHDANGDLRTSGDVDLERCTAVIDPETSTVFVFGFRRTPFLVAIDLARGDVVEHTQDSPHWVDMGTELRILGPGRCSALYRDTVDDRYSEGLLTMTSDGRFGAVAFETSCQSFLFGDDVMSRVETARTGMFARVSMTRPPIEESDGQLWAVLNLDVFDNVDAAPRALRIATVGIEPETRQEIDGFDDETRELHDVLGNLFRSVKSFVFDAAGESIWIAFLGGFVRRVDISTGELSPFFKPGFAPDRDHPNINEIFDRTPTNSPTLAVSPDGRFVAFSNPNVFFSVDEVDLASPDLFVDLPRASGKLTESPKNIVPIHNDANQILIQAHGGHFWRVDLSTQAIVDRFHIQWGDCGSASMSPDGRLLALAMSGADPVIVDLDDNEVYALPVPAHTVLSRFIGRRRLVMLHHDGAVLDIDLDAAEFDAARFGYEEEIETGGADFESMLAVVDAEQVWGIDPEKMGDEPIFDMDALEIFEQATPVHGVDFCHVGTAAYVAIVKEMGILERFTVGDDGITAAGPWQGATGIWKDVGGNRDFVASINRETGKLKVVGVNDTLEYELEVGEHTRILGMVDADGPRIWLFGERDGRLRRFDAVTQLDETVFQYQGGAVEWVAFDASGGRLLVREADRATQVFDLRTGEQTCAFELVISDDRQLEFV